MFLHCEMLIFLIIQLVSYYCNKKISFANLNILIRHAILSRDDFYLRYHTFNYAIENLFLGKKS